MKKILFLLFALMLCLTQIVSADDTQVTTLEPADTQSAATQGETAPSAVSAAGYRFPENYNDLAELTYNSIYRFVEMEGNLSYDLFLFDKFFLTLSAAERSRAMGLNFGQMKEYYQQSLAKYEPHKNFLLMIVVYDDNATLNLDNFAKEVGIQNSKGEVIYGEGLETYTGLIYIIRYPKDQVDKIFQDEKNFIINLKDSKNKYHQVKFQTNYSSDIPKPIHELVELLAK